MVTAVRWPAVSSVLSVISVLSVGPATAQVESAKVDSFIAAAIKERNLVGVQVGIMQDGRIAFARGYGEASIPGAIPVDTTTRFAIGSVTKQFTCAIILQLAAEGKLSVNDPVSKYFKGLTRADEITLLDLMNHVSGYPDYYPLDFLDRRMLKATTPAKVVATYASMKLDFEPGTRYSYSNTGFTMLGIVAEKASGQPFGKLLRERIFKPFDMPNTVYDPRETGKGYAQGYSSFALGPLTPAAREGAGWADAAGAIYSTAPDLLRWDRALMEGKVLQGEWLALMTRPRVLKDSSVSSYGTGLGIGKIGTDTAWAHTGAVAGFAAQNFMVPASKSAIVILANTEVSARAGALWRLVLPVTSPPPPDSNAPKPKAPAETPAPSVQGPPAEAMATTLLKQMQAGTVDRKLFDPEFNWYLTDAKVREAAPRLAQLGDPVQTTVLGTSERGGLEVSVTQFAFASGQKVNALMYRAPDGIVHQYLLLAP